MLSVRWASREEACDFLLETNIDDWKPVEQHLQASTHFIIVSNEHPLGLWGFAPVTLLSTTAYVWLVTVSDLPKLPFIRASRQTLGMFFSHFDRGVGYCYRADTMKWLRWLGMTFGPRDEIGFPWSMTKNG